MLKRMGAMLLAILMLASVIVMPLPAIAMDNYVTIRLHYHRPDGNYEDWEAWLWDMDDITSLNPPYELHIDPVNGDAVCEFQVKTGTNKIGYIIRKPDWECKDVDHDQYINITGVLSGTVDFYVESVIPTQPNASEIPSLDELVAKGNLVLSDDAIIGSTVVSATYRTGYYGNPELVVLFGGDVRKADYTAADFQITDNRGNGVSVQQLRWAGSYCYLTLDQTFKPTRTYTLTLGDNTYKVIVPDLFQTEEFIKNYTYTGDNLGATYTREKTTLRVWAPLAQEVSVNLYRNGDPQQEAEPFATIPMTSDVQGTWVATLEGDYAQIYYTYGVVNDEETVEACDPYARTTGINGKRAMILDLDATNPTGWNQDANPNAGINMTDAIIYEVHLRDISAHSSAGIDSIGKYKGLIQRGTRTEGGIPTGLDHIVDLGVTHIQLMPVYDFGSINETQESYNWGYDPVNYNVPEGSYSSNPYNGFVRVNEMKQMVQGLHDAGLSVVMDVVYTHVYASKNFCFNQIVPGYFCRKDSNGSGCGNDTATERPMVRKYIVDSVNYWATEYHIDGFRFDLAGLIDVDTVNEIMSTVKKTRPDVVFYGEGWQLSTNTKEPLCTQTNSGKVPGFAFFSDTFRNTIKGYSFGGVTYGYISGAIVDSNILYRLFTGMPSWLNTPSQSINYLSSHDGYTLFDHLTLVRSECTKAELAAMNRLGAAFLMTSQGVPFLQAGEEFLRSKPNGDWFDDNSYNSPDEVNAMRWEDLEDPAYQAVYQYYKGLIAFRKAHPALRMTDANAIYTAVTQYNTGELDVNAYQITTGDETLLVVFNPNKSAIDLRLPAGTWDCYVNGQTAGTSVLNSYTGSVQIDGFSASVFVRDDSAPIIPPVTPPEEPTEGLLGDVNGDGKVNTKDWSLLYDYIAEKKMLSEDQILRGDVTQDGKTNMKDWTRLYDHITEANPFDKPKMTLKVWATDWDISSGWLESRLRAFEKAHPEYAFSWDVGAYSEGDVGYRVANNPTAAADVFMFVSDQLSTLYTAGALAKLDGSYATQVLENNAPVAVQNVTGINGALYGFPASPNTWFMYYDKSVFTEEDIQSMETMLTKGTVAFDFTNAWYGASFFLGAGGTLFGPEGIDAAAGVDFKGITGVAVARKMVEMYNSGNLIQGWQSELLANRKVGAYFSGYWDYDLLKRELGDDLGVAALPTFTVEGQTYRMKSFATAKTIGVNDTIRDAEKKAIAMELAAFLANEESQLTRYELTGTTPLHKDLSDCPEVKSNPVASVHYQIFNECSIAQPSIPAMSNYWTPMGWFGAGIVNGDVTVENAGDMLQQALDEMNK